MSSGPQSGTASDVRVSPALCVDFELFPSGRQDRARFGPQEEWTPRSLQLLDPQADGGLRDIEPVTGRRESACVGDVNEGTDQGAASPFLCGINGF